MQAYHFDEELFKTNFKTKDTTEKSEDSCRLNHVPDKCFKLFPYKATTRNASPIVYELSETVSGFFRRALEISSETVDFDGLCEVLIDSVEIDEEDDVDFFKDIIRTLFFKNGIFRANNIGLYPYQISTENKNADRIAEFLFFALGIDEQDKECIKKAKENHPFNVLEKMVVDAIKKNERVFIAEKVGYYQIKRSIQRRFKDDFEYMLDSGMTSVDDISNVLAIYYFYYVTQSVMTLEQFGNGDHDRLEPIYFALDWEKVSKNRKCCEEGWEKLSNSISRIFSHAITLEILNQNEEPMMDYIDFKVLADSSEETDVEIANEVKRAEETYKSYVGDCKKFESLGKCPGANHTDAAIRHLFESVLLQFNETERKRASQFYAEKFSEFGKNRFVKNRKKSGLVLNLTERDVIFLTKLAVRDNDKIRLNELFEEYELRGVYLDSTSKMLLQDYFTKLNLIDKKSDSGDAQYVKRIL